MAARDTVYSWWGKLPFKLGSAVLSLVGLASALRPERLQEWTGANMRADFIRQAGIWALAASSVYFFVLWLLKPSRVSGVSAGVTITGGTHYHQYATLPEMLKQRQTPAPTLIQPHSTFHAHLVETVEASDTLEATAVTGLHGLYVGNVIVAAGELESGRRLELAIIGFNGTGESIRLLDFSGRIRAGTGNMRDFVKLPEPVMQGVFKAEPWGEFIMTFRQELSEDQAIEYLRSLEDNRSVSLDLREWEIVIVSARNPDKSGRLPLWDGVNLRRRDDVVSNRSTILSVDLVGETGKIIGAATVTRKEEGAR